MKYGYKNGFFKINVNDPIHVQNYNNVLISTLAHIPVLYNNCVLKATYLCDEKCMNCLIYTKNENIISKTGSTKGNIWITI